VLAVFLAVFGIVSFVLAWLHWTQQLFGKEQAVRVVVCVLLGRALIVRAHTASACR
jgi:hypothetical protein